MEDDTLSRLRSDHGNHEWWWCFDNSLSRIQYLLHSKGHVIVDQFLPSGDAEKVAVEIQNLYHNGHLSKQGIIGGGRYGKDYFEIDKEIRSDVLGYFDGNEDCFGDKNVVPLLIDKMNTLLCEMRDLVPEKCTNGKNHVRSDLKNVSTRSKAMVTCYAGNQARYARHVDNPTRNGRRVTCIFYTNKTWTSGDGGCLDVFPVGLEKESIAPLFNRLALFWSDERCPHEVTPCETSRFALSVWFIDKAEKEAEAEAVAAELISQGITPAESLIVEEGHSDIAPTAADAPAPTPVPNPTESTDAGMGVFGGMDSAPMCSVIPYTISETNDSQISVLVRFSYFKLSREDVLGFSVDAFDIEIRISPPDSESDTCRTYLTAGTGTTSIIGDTTIQLPHAIDRRSVQAKYQKKSGNLLCTRKMLK